MTKWASYYKSNDRLVFTGLKMIENALSMSNTIDNTYPVFIGNDNWCTGWTSLLPQLWCLVIQSCIPQVVAGLSCPEVTQRCVRVSDDDLNECLATVLDTRNT